MSALPSIHDEPRTGVKVTRDGQRIEYPIRVDPNRYLPLILAMDSWLQEVTLEGLTNMWWRAQKRKQDREMHMTGTAFRDERGLR